MNKIIFYTCFVCLIGFSARSGSPAFAGGCSNHTDKKAEINCAKNDTDCQTQESEKFDLKVSANS